MTTIAAEERERTPVDATHPWPGLFSFDEPAQKFFRGRDQEIDELFHLVMKSRVAVFYGMAGLGKTSLLQAGLFPRLRNANLLPVPVRLDFKAGIPLVQQVRDALAREVTAAGGEVPPLDADATLWENLHRRDALFWNERNRVAMPVLVFDQFEEIFTLGNDAPDRRQFLEQMADLVEGTTPKALMRRLRGGSGVAAVFDHQRHHYAVVFTLREDYLPDFEMLRQIMPSTVHPRKRLGRMRMKAAEAVLSVGRDLVDEETSREIIRFVAGAGNNDAPEAADEELEIEPALLSVVCALLNEKRIAAGLPRIEKHLLDTNRNTIIEDFYQSAMEGLSANVRRMVEEGLLTSAGFRDSIAEDRALKEFGVDDATIHKLMRRRLIRIETRGLVRRIELTHDLLTRVVADSRERSRRARDEEDRQRERQAREEAEERERKARENERRAQESEQMAIQSEQRARKSERRARAQLRATLIAFACVVALVAIVIFLNTARQRERQIAKIRQDEAARKAADWAFNAGLTQIAEGRQAQALALFAHAIRTNPENAAARSMAVSLMLDQPWYVPRRSWRTKDPPESLELSGDGRHLLESAGTTVTLRDTETAAGTTLTYPTPVSFAGFTPAGNRFIIAGDIVQVWNVSPMKLLRSWSESSAFTRNPTMSPDGKYLAVETLEAVVVRRTDSGAVIARIPALGLNSFIRFSSTSDKVAIVTETLTETTRGFDVNVWTLASGRRQRKRTVAASSVCVDIRHDLAVVAVCTDDGVALVDVEKGTTTKVPSSSETSRVLFRPEGSEVLLADSSTLRLWPAWRSIRRIVDLTSEVFTRDGSRVLAVSSDGVVTCLRADALTPCAAPLYHSDDEAVTVASSANGDRIVTAAGNVVRIWATPGVLGVINPYGTSGRTRLSEDGSRMFVSDAPRLQVRDTHSGRQIATVAGTLMELAPVTGTAIIRTKADSTRSRYATWDGSPQPPQSIVDDDLRNAGLAVTISADGRRAAFMQSPFVRMRNRLIPSVSQVPSRKQVSSWPQVYDLTSRKRVDLLPPESAVLHVALDRTGSRMATMTRNNTLVVYDVASGRELTKTDRFRWIQGLTFDRSGRLLLISTQTAAVVVGASTLQPVGPALNHPVPVMSAEFNADASKVVTVSVDGQVRIWDLKKGVVERAIRHRMSVWSASFSPDGRRVVTKSGTSDTTEMRIWDAATGSALTPPIRSYSFAPVISFTRTGVTYLVRDNGIAVRQLPDTSAQEGPLLADLAEAVAGVAVQGEGSFTASPKRLATVSVPPALGQSVAARVLQCFAEKQHERPLSPFTTRTARQYVDSQLREMPSDSFEIARKLADAYPGLVPEEVLRDLTQDRVTATGFTR